MSPLPIAHRLGDEAALAGDTRVDMEHVCLQCQRFR